MKDILYTIKDKDINFTFKHLHIQRQKINSRLEIVSFHVRKFLGHILEMV